MKLVIGLGNPEPEYSWTRHNIGKDALNIFIDKSIYVHQSINWTLRNRHNSGEVRIGSEQSERLKAEVLRIPTDTYADHDIIVAKPLVHMNVAGEMVSSVLNYFKIEPENMVVLYDELDLKVGEYKLGKNGSRIHNGIVSVKDHVKSEFWHLRIGVRQVSIKGSVQKTGRDPAKYVLGKFNTADRKKISKTIIQSVIPTLTDWLSKN